MAEFTFAMLMYLNAATTFIIAELTALLPLRYPNQNPFVTLPTTMSVIVSSTTVYYLLQIGIIVFPRSRFSVMAKHLTPFFAYVAVFSLVAALFPDHRATAFIYTIFALLVAGHALFKLGFTTGFRRYKNKLAGGVAAFFEEQATQPDDPRPHVESA